VYTSLFSFGERLRILAHSLRNAPRDHGPFHWTPLEAFKGEFPHSDATADQLTVISWILPHIRATKQDNRTQTFYPAERWARARIFGEEVNV